MKKKSVLRSFGLVKMSFVDPNSMSSPSRKKPVSTDTRAACCMLWVTITIFFFQAEDGIRDKLVTGVQTCALPISPRAPTPSRPRCARSRERSRRRRARSEERRVGKECRSRWTPYHEKEIRPPLLRSGEDVVRGSEFNELTVEKEARLDRHSRGLLHVVGDDHNFFFSSRRRHTR